MNRKLAQPIFAAVLVAAVLAGVAFKAHATPPSGLTTIPLARATNQSDGTIPFQFGTDVVMSKIIGNPGASSGWHSHPGGAIVLVTQGTIDVYASAGNGCQVTRYTAGQAFVERPGEVDQVLNVVPAGVQPEDVNSYILFVTFPRVPVGQRARTDADNPGTCPGV